MSLGDRLTALREQKALTQREVAILTKISRSRLSLYEINKREPDIATLRQLATFFNVTVDYLIGYSDTVAATFTEPDSTINLNTILNAPHILWHGNLLSIEDKNKLKATLDIIFWNAKNKEEQKKS